MYRDDRHKLVNYHGLGYGELYDLESNPLEDNNLWEAPSAAALRAGLTQNSFDATVAACAPGPTRSVASEPPRLRWHCTHSTGRSPFSDRNRSKAWNPMLNC